jgi:flagella basal body P-ring formation protein FlgA
MLAYLLLPLVPGISRGQATVRLSALGGEVPPRLAARVADAVARAWGVDTAGLVLSWGSGSLADMPDTAAFRLFGRGDGGWFAVTVEPANRPPKAIRLRAGTAVSRVVAARALRPGMRLTEADLRQEPALRWGPPPAAEEPVPAPGWIVKRMVSPGDPLDRMRVEPPPVVAAGQPVRVSWNQGNVSIALEGTALNDATLGGTVRVRTGERVGVLTGTVTAPGEARMP